MTKKLSLLIVILFWCVGGLQARQPYHARIIVGPETALVSEPNPLNLVEALRTSAINQLIPFYTPVTETTFIFNLRGITSSGFFPANSSTLIFNLPQLGVTEIFTGRTRDESLQLLDNYIKNVAPKNKRFFPLHAKFTSIDPIAGNPNSLMSQMAQADYLLGRLSPLSGCDGCWSAQPVVHQFQAGLNQGRAFSANFDTTIFTSPLRYSYSPNGDFALILDGPISLLKNGGAYSIVGSLGLGVRFPLTRQWSLTPILRVGAGGTIDMCTAGTFLATGILSNLDYPIRNFVISMTNYAGYFCSTPMHLGGINFDYHLYSFCLKNGVYLTSCKGYHFCGKTLNFNLTFTDTYFPGDKLFIDHYDEIAFNLMTTHVNPFIEYDCLSLGFAYQFGKESYKGYFFNLVYQF